MIDEEDSLECQCPVCTSQDEEIYDEAEQNNY